jgi:hypothetical protein
VERRPWEICSCLREGTAIHSFQLFSSEDKERLIGLLELLLAGDGEEHELLRQKGALLADELLENALYDAPRAADGSKLFRKGEKRVMLPEERIVFSFGFDGETLGPHAHRQLGESRARSGAGTSGPQPGGRPDRG